MVPAVAPSPGQAAKTALTRFAAHGFSRREGRRWGSLHCRSGAFPSRGGVQSPRGDGWTQAPF